MRMLDLTIVGYKLTSFGKQVYNTFINMLHSIAARLKNCNSHAPNIFTVIPVIEEHEKTKSQVLWLLLETSFNSAILILWLNIENHSIVVKLSVMNS